MAKQIRTLTAGTKVVLSMHGSKRFGNAPYELETVFVGLSEDGERAEFDDFEAYRYNGHWAYGSGAMKLSVKEVLSA